MTVLDTLIRWTKGQPPDDAEHLSRTVDSTGEQETLERILVHNIIPFWYPRTVDQNDGGYLLNHDSGGVWKGPAGKRLVAQARMLLFFSRLARSRFARPEYLVAAQHGFSFLSGRMWDREYGGFFWETDHSGTKPTMPQKHVYAQAFALYALCRYAAASGDRPAIDLARDLYELMDEHAHDAANGGYRENFLRDWSLPPADAFGYIGARTGVKLMNTHMHLLEAMTEYYRLTADQRVGQRLAELITIQSNAVVRKSIGMCTDRHAADWTPLDDRDAGEISFGHNVENVTFLINACDAAGISCAPLVDLFRSIFAFTLRYGFDHTNGGFLEACRYSGAAHKKEKVWWVQAEGLLGSLHMFRLTGEDVYFRCFQRELEWIARRQADWSHGEWHDRIAVDGKPTGDKAGPWKDPYHHSRALLRCLDILESQGSGKLPCE